MYMYVQWSERRQLRLEAIPSGYTQAFFVYNNYADLKVLCDGSRMRTTIHYVVIKPDSRPDGTAIWDHARVRVYTSSRERRCATNCESK